MVDAVQVVAPVPGLVALWFLKALASSRCGLLRAEFYRGGERNCKSSGKKDGIDAM
jgi:hypothetical protein